MFAAEAARELSTLEEVVEAEAGVLTEIGHSQRRAL
jgi:hypothetical protein